MGRSGSFIPRRCAIHKGDLHWGRHDHNHRYQASMENIECVVIGAGVVGLAVARELVLGGREVIVLERASSIGTETSSRNSEVVHAGLYYPPGSFKAKFCVEGRGLLYNFC